MNYIAGIDGAKCGWVCISAHINNLKNPKFFFAKTLTQLINDKIDLVLIDMPVGLDMFNKKGGRKVDQLARKKLIRRKSSIFNAPSRLTLKANSYDEANKLNKKYGLGLSKQSWNLVPKIKELDLILKSKKKTKIYESHPELIFQEMNNGFLEFKKKEKRGIDERYKILINNGFESNFIKEFLQEKKRNYNSDDFLDACALFWSAKRTLKGKNFNIPLEPTIDSQGILMQMKI